MLRALALMLEGKTAQSIEIFDALIAKDPSLVEARFNRAVALLKLGDSARAAAAFDQIAKDPAATTLRATALYHYALALDRLGRAAEAEAALERVLTLDATFDPARLLLGSLRERRGQFEPAARMYSEYLKRNPDSAIAALRFGVCAQRAGRTDVAIAYLRRAIEKAPQSPEAMEARKYLVMWE